ncbi:MAG TPA: POTRA domain-containing protein [Verrucomicrobiae bacterium]|nr:POTRA domain-containing protein [Verrucomicrobiae bacterium]
MARVAIWLLVLLLAAPAAIFSSAPPQTETASSRLASVRVNGSSHFTSEQIAPYTGLTPGTMVTRADLQSAANRLADLGCFSGVQYKFSTGPSGVDVQYSVADAPELAVEFDNFIWFNDAQLAAGLTQSGFLFDGQAPDHGILLDDLSSALEKLLDARGVHAEVSHQISQDPASGNRVVQFSVEGLDLTVSSLDFTDPLAKSSPEIQQLQNEIVGKPYSRIRLELFEQEHVLPLYHSHAYLQAGFGPTSARFTPVPGSPSPNAIAAVIAVNPGLAYKWGGVVWQGRTAMPSSLLDALVDLKPGDLADGVKLQGLWFRVQDLYGQHGYLDATVSPNPEFDKNTDRVTFDVTIHDGPQYHMDKLVLSGLSIEGERRIRAAWPIPEGNIFDASAYQTFLTTGIKDAFAGLPVHYDKIGRFLDKHPDTAQVNVLMDFE